MSRSGTAHSSFLRPFLAVTITSVFFTASWPSHVAARSISGGKSTCSGAATGAVMLGAQTIQQQEQGGIGKMPKTPGTPGTPGTNKTPSQRDLANLMLLRKMNREMEKAEQLALAKYGKKSGSDQVNFGTNRNNPTGENIRGQKADPVIMPTGNFHDIAVDLGRIGGSTDFALIRNYNSMDAWQLGSFGRGWRFQWNIALREDEGGMWVVFGDGMRYFFAFKDDHYVTPAGSHYRLEVGENNVYSLLSPQGEVYEFADPEHMKVTAIRGIGSNKLEFIYLPLTGLLKEVSDPFGNAIRFSYDVQGRIVEARDSTGRSVRYEYNILGFLVAARGSNGKQTIYDYDLQGNLIRKVMPGGLEVLSRYDEAHRVIVQGDASNPELFQFRYFDEEKITQAIRGSDVTAYHYDENFQILKEIEPTGLTLEREFDEKGNLVAFHQKGASQHVITSRFQYDDAGNLQTQRDPLGNKTSYTYDTNNKLLSQTDPLGNTIRYSYDMNGRLSTATDAMGNITRYRMTEFNQPLEVQYPSGASVHYSYDEQHRLQEMWRTDDSNARVSLVRYQYDPHGNILSVLDAEGDELRYEYDSDGNVTKEIMGRSPSTLVATEYTYDDSGNLILVKDPKGRVTEFSYAPDWYGSIQEIVRADGLRTQFEVDAYGRRIKSIQPDGRVIETAYDALDRPIKVWDASTLLAEYLYDEFGNLQSITDKIGREKSFAYNALGQTIAVTDHLGNRTQLSWDANGNLLQRIEPNGAKTTFQYDRAGNLVTQIDPLGNTQTYEWTKHGQLAARYDERTAKTSYRYDSVGNLIGVGDPLGNTMQIQRDKVGRVVQEVFPSGGWRFYRYDFAGRVVEIRGSDGLTQQRVYDTVGNLLEAIRISPTGEKRSTRLAYDDADRLVQVTDALGNTTHYEYDKYGRQTALRDQAGFATSYEYDLEGRVQAVTDALGAVTRYRYDEAGNVTAVVAPSGRTTHYRWNQDGQVQEVINPLGARTRFAYDVVGNLTETVDPLGLTTRSTHDLAGRLIRRVVVGSANEEAITHQYTYDPTGNVSAVTDPLGNVSRFEHDAMGRVIKATNPLGHSTQWSYHPSGEMGQITDPLGQITKIERDPQGRMLALVDPMGSRTSYTYDVFGNMAAVQDALGNSTQFSYDSNGRISSVTDALGGATKYEYDARGNLIRTIDAKGNSLKYQYDALNRISQNLFNRYTYDGDGHLIAITDKLGNETQYQYDAASRLSQSIDALGNIQKVSYDLRGNLIEQQDPNGYTHKSHYDSFGRTIAQIDPLGGETQYQYDRAGRLVSTTDAKGSKTGYDYDKIGRVVQKKDPLGRKTSFEYDALGRLIAKLDAKGKRVRYQYDPNGRMTKTLFADQTQQLYAYDALGRLLSAQTPQGLATRFEHDALGRVLKEISISADGQESARRNAYDAVGNRIQTQLGDEDPIQYTYDDLNRPTIIASEKYGDMTRFSSSKRDRVSSVSTRFSYDALGRRSAMTLPNGMATQYQHDALSRVTEIRSSNDVGEIIQKTAYTFDRAGNPIEKQQMHQGITHPNKQLAQITRYIYDQNNRLIEENIKGPQGGQARTYQYDAVGNRLASVIVSETKQSLTTTYQYNPAHELIAEQLPDGTRIEYAYDPLGNLKEKRAGPLKTSFAYDPTGLLKQVVASEGDVRDRVPGISTTKYTYDALGRRVSKENIAASEANQFNSTTHFQYDGLSLSKEMVQHQGVSQQRNYLQGPGMGEVLGVISEKSADYFIQDLLGSVVGVVGPKQSLKQISYYDAFGNPSVTAGKSGDMTRFSSSNRDRVPGFPVIFAGHMLDTETGMYQARARYYAPNMGRFTTPDPLSQVPDPTGQLISGPNPYSYVRNNPLKYTDPLGLLEKEKTQGPNPYAPIEEPQPLRKQLPALGQMVALAKKLVHEEMVRLTGMVNNRTNDFTAAGRDPRPTEHRVRDDKATSTVWDEHQAGGNTVKVVVDIYSKTTGDGVSGIVIQSFWRTPKPSYSDWNHAISNVLFTSGQAELVHMQSKGPGGMTDWWAPGQGQPPLPPDMTPGGEFVPGSDWASELSKIVPEFAGQFGLGGGGLPGGVVMTPGGPMPLPGSGASSGTMFFKGGKTKDPNDQGGDGAKGPKKPVVIGENMKDRVIPTAKELGADYYKPRNTSGDPMQKNKRWIDQVKRDGRTVYDVGRDPKRSEAERSQKPDFYGMEHGELGKSSYPTQPIDID